MFPGMTFLIPSRDRDFVADIEALVRAAVQRGIESEAAYANQGSKSE